MEPRPKTGTPPITPPPTLSPDIAGKDAYQCQWFLGEKNFCDKIKKSVRCDGNVRKCPF